MASVDPKSPLIGILDSAELSAENRTLCLSAEELQECSAIHNPRRADEWLAGRIAAKFLFMQRERSVTHKYFELNLQKITRKQIVDYTPEMYRDVKVARDKSPAGGPAQVGRIGGDPVKVAISHVNGLACAFIGSSDVYSVDLEARASRVPEFYLHNFTPQERSWTGDCARSFDLDSDWLFTFLWSAKECLMKTPQFSGLSLWDLPSIELRILTGSERLKAIHDTNGLSGKFEFLQVEMASGPRLQGWSHPEPFQLAVSGTTDLILTAITRLD
jgi:hypothetical protein